MQQITFFSNPALLGELEYWFKTSFSNSFISFFTCLGLLSKKHKLIRMRKEIESKFHQLVADRFGYFEAKHIHMKMGLPAHPVTKAFKSPENTPHKVLIAFSDILGIHPFELIRDYDMGIERISEIEKDYHQKAYANKVKLS